MDEQNINQNGERHSEPQPSAAPQWQPEEKQDNGYQGTYGTGPYTEGYVPPFERYTPPFQGPPPKRHGWQVAIACVCCLAFCVAVLGGVRLSAWLLDRPSGGDFSIQQASADEDAMGYLDSVQNSSYESVSDIAEDVGQSVVTIVITLSYGSTLDAYTTQFLGSGVIIGEDADKIFIATNYEVIASASDVSIIAGTDESTAIQAYYQGSDVDTNLAVIFIRKADVPEAVRSQMKIATLGDSAAMRLGDLAIAIGSPVDKSFGNSVTVGAISGLERSVSFIDEETQTTQTMTLMQTDAAINPGNYGGALVNGRGEVIGINCSKITSTEVEGMGFAIPSNIAVPVLEDLVNYGKVSRPYIGITGGNAASYQDFAAQYQIVSGVIVVTVVQQGPAALAGLQPYDIIITFDGKPVEDFDDLSAAIDEAGVGKTVEVEVLRGYQQGEAETTMLTLTIQEKDSTGR